MRGRRAAALTAAGALCIGLLAGCGEKQVDYGIDGEKTTEAEAQADEESGVGQFAGEEKWEENWSVTDGNGDTLSITVSADITVPDVDRMSVVEVQETVPDAEFRERIVRGLFSDAPVYYNDEEHWPKEQIEKQIGYLEAVIQAWEGYQEESWDESVEEDLRDMREDLAEYESRLAAASDDYTPVTEYDSDAYRIEQDGVVYLLDFIEESYINDAITTRTVRMQRERYEDELYPEEFPKDLQDGGVVEYEVAGESTEENRCGLTEQEAREIADRTLASVGASGFVPEETKQLVWKHYTQDDAGTYAVDQEVPDGWVFSYGMGADGLSFRRFGTEWNYSMDEMVYLVSIGAERKIYSMDAGIEVRVMDEGVVEFRWKNPIEITSVTKDVKLLPLEEIKSIMQDELAENADCYAGLGRTSFFDSMELIYFRVMDREREGCYCYVPAWRLSSYTSDYTDDTSYYETVGSGQGGNIRHPVLVNAIDGSIIYLNQEFNNQK